MVSADRKKIREEAKTRYDELNTPGTTVHAVAHVRDPHAGEGSDHDGEKVMWAFDTILPRMQAVLNKIASWFQGPQLIDQSEIRQRAANRHTSMINEKEREKLRKRARRTPHPDKLFKINREK